ncbi:ATP-dependent endonuclease [Microbacterium capsulatum]|uniref:ATP-dependent endonuclease n=1 Tax=Microbacterium capsulatum TaxID=3041921 RepID=A0ABU0XLE3_9MICO|nr:ATP-dependent endonuclease [Microbacterium sp. ASV81]MDQ4214950.1 ATP-dependent endonuclease [Microbacterium sp. ASV81]
MVLPIVLVEGESDRLALIEAALVRGEPSLDARADVVSLGGITNLRSWLERRDPLVPVRGLYDAAELRYVVGALVASGMLPDGVSDPDPDPVAALGFFGCDQDLEDEVIRAAGPELVLETLAARGELALFRTFQGQPAQRVRSVEAQLHRFAATASGRKARFAADVIAALPAERLPDPLARVLDAVR